MDKVIAVTRNFNNEKMTRGCIEAIVNAALFCFRIVKNYDTP
jgi:hypothetical protein